MNVLYLIGAVLATILASARLTRLAVYDDFPPVKWLRHKYQDATDGSDWSLLAMCGYCFSFWATLAVVLTGWQAGVYGPGTEPVGEDAPWFMLWWLVCGPLAASYLAAAFVANDGDGSDR